MTLTDALPNRRERGLGHRARTAPGPRWVLVAALAAALLPATTATPQHQVEWPADSGVRQMGPELDYTLGPWHVECFLQPYELPAPPEVAMRPKLPVATRLSSYHVYYCRAMFALHRNLPRSVRGVTCAALNLIDHGVQAMMRLTRLTRLIDTPDLDAAQPGPLDTPGAVGPDRRDEFGAALLIPPAPEQWMPDLNTFWEYFDAGWPTDQTRDASSETRSPPATSDAVTRIAAPHAATAGSAGFFELFMQSTSVAFLAAVLAVPFGCGFVAGTMYGRPRDGPQLA